MIDYEYIRYYQWNTVHPVKLTTARSHPAQTTENSASALLLIQFSPNKISSSRILRILTALLKSLAVAGPRFLFIGRANFSLANQIHR